MKIKLVVSSFFFTLVWDSSTSTIGFHLATERGQARHPENPPELAATRQGPSSIS